MPDRPFALGKECLRAGAADQYPAYIRGIYSRVHTQTHTNTNKHTTRPDKVRCGLTRGGALLIRGGRLVPTVPQLPSRWVGMRARVQGKGMTAHLAVSSSEETPRGPSYHQEGFARGGAGGGTQGVRERGASLL